MKNNAERGQIPGHQNRKILSELALAGMIFLSTIETTRADMGDFLKAITPTSVSASVHFANVTEREEPQNTEGEGGAEDGKSTGEDKTKTEYFVGLGFRWGDPTSTVCDGSMKHVPFNFIEGQPTKAALMAECALEQRKLQEEAQGDTKKSFSLNVEQPVVTPTVFTPKEITEVGIRAFQNLGLQSKFK